MAGYYFRQALVHVLLRNICCRSVFTPCVFVGPCYSFLLRAVIDGRSSWAPKYLTSQYATPTSPPPGTSSRLYKSHGLSVRNPNKPHILLYSTMDAFRALLSRTRSPTVVADPEAQPQPRQDCARRTIPFNGPNRASALSRHDDPPLPSLLSCPEDPPPYTPYPPPPASDPSGSATNETALDGSNRYVVAILVFLTLGLFATVLRFTFFNHSKV